MLRFRSTSVLRIVGAVFALGGPAVALPTMPIDLSSSVLVQLRAGTGACWQSVHGTAAANTTTKFVSKTGVRERRVPHAISRPAVRPPLEPTGVS